MLRRAAAKSVIAVLGPAQEVSDAAEFCGKDSQKAREAAQNRQALRSARVSSIGKAARRAGIGVPPMASWRSGYAEDCKSLHPGSIPGEASTFLPKGRPPERGLADGAACAHVSFRTGRHSAFAKRMGFVMRPIRNGFCLFPSSSAVEHSTVNR